MDRRFDWHPYQFRNLATGEMMTREGVETAHNGRVIGSTGHLTAWVEPYGAGVRIVFDAPSWEKAYFCREFADRDDAVAIAERVLTDSQGIARDMIRDGLYKRIDLYAAELAAQVKA